MAEKPIDVFDYRLFGAASTGYVIGAHFGDYLYYINTINDIKNEALSPKDKFYILRCFNQKKMSVEHRMCINIPGLICMAILQTLAFNYLTKRLKKTNS